MVNAVCKSVKVYTHLTFAGSSDSTRLKRPCPDNQTFVQVRRGIGVHGDVPKAVPEMIRSSIGPSSVGGAMVVGVDAPLGVVERDRPKRLKKLVDFEEMAEMALNGVGGLESTRCAARLRSEPFLEGPLEGVGVS
jgi:hypothetical protein